MNSVVNPVTSYGFTASQTSLGGMAMGRGYGTSTAANLHQRPSFAIQELLGLGASQLGATSQAQGFTPQLFPTNDVTNSGMSYPYQNFTTGSPPSMTGQASSMAAESPDFSTVNSMYGGGMGWRTAGFLSGYPREDTVQHRPFNHTDMNGHSPDKHALSPISQGKSFFQ